MTWRKLAVASDGTHHTHPDGRPAYADRFDLVLKFHEPGLAPVARGESAWHIRDDGEPAYSRKFRRTFGYYEGLAAVCTDDGWHHISPSGEPAYEERYAWCGNVQESRCAVRDLTGSYFHIQSDGYAAYRDRWRYAGDYRDGLAVVQGQHGLSTHIDSSGRLVHGKWFVDLDVFHKGFARARDEDGWTHIAVDGRPRYTRRFAAVEPFYNGQARVERLDGALEVIDEAGNTFVELRPPRESVLARLSADMVGYWRTQTIGAAVALSIFDSLPATEIELGGQCRMTADGTHRLLRALQELDLVVTNGALWTLTPRGELLRRDDPLTLADAALEYAGPLSHVWRQLPKALLLNSDWKAPDVFGEVARDQSRCAGHHHMLRSYARHDYPNVVRAFKLAEGERFVDAGGGLGVLAQMVLDAYPLTEATVLDRPEVIELACRQSPGSEIQWCAGDIFGPWGVSADVALLSRVLHDWDDQPALAILRRAREALPTGGRVFIIEMVLAEESAAGALCDLHLLVATGGRERTASEYERLLTEAGFTPAGVHSVAALPSVVQGVAT